MSEPPFGTPHGPGAPQMSDEECRLLAEFVRDRFGLELHLSHRDRVRYRLRGRLEAHAMATFLEYYHYLVLSRDAPKELPYLAEALTNNETYFFREAYQFEAFFQTLAPAIHGARPPEEPIRILSAGCSSGEEPYSLSMVALENQFRFMGRPLEIHAFDLSAAKIAWAEAGEYEASSFRAASPELKERYFTPAGARFRVKAWVRNPVRLKILNLLDLGDAYEPGFFDAVFCRNVLIYFGDEAMYRICGLFHKLLRKSGALFLGHSESLLGRTSLFRPQRASDFIYYVRVEP